MLAVLPVIAYWLFWRWMNPRCESWRDAALMAALVWGVYLTTVTEILSLFGWLTSVGLVVAWGAAVVGIVWSVFGRAEARPYEHTDNVGMAFWPSAGLIALLLIILITGITAFIAPPNTWDSMTYHMARVAHWVQNQSIDHYPASDLRQLYQHPWAEYAITHLYVLAGSDR
jgi:drug/metabolite transporter (DMT)-like permease